MVASMVTMMFWVPAGAASARMTRPVKGVAEVGSTFYDAKVTAADLDNDGTDELLIGNHNGQLYCFTPAAQVKWAFNCGAKIQGAPACFDVDGNGDKEVFFGDMNGVVWGLGANGNVLTQWGWPKQTAASGGFVGVYGSPAIGDINADGAVDIVTGSWGHYVYAWSYTGGLLPGWPFDSKDTVWSSPALADIDRDGLKEVVVGGDSTGGSGWPYPAGGLLWAFNQDASVCPGFPVVTPEVIWSSPACADIDNDGFFEIVVGTGHYYKATGRLSTEGHVVYAFDHNGAMCPGWPVAAQGSTFSSPAVGDVDGDGVKEVAIACNPVRGIGADRLMLIKGSGAAMWDIPAFGGPNLGCPAMGDVTSDGRPEVIIGSGQAIGAWDAGGNCVWNQVLDNFVISSPAVGDFDRDGRVEVAVGTGGDSGGGSFYVFDCGSKRRASSEKIEAVPWPQFRRDAPKRGAILTGYEPPPPPPRANFHEYILLMNPGRDTAFVKVELMNEKAEVRVIEWTVAPGSRSTIFVNKYMSGCGVSAKVASSVPVICERAMYFDFQGRWKGGTDSAGAPEPSRTWYLAEGYTADHFDEYVLVQNPGGTPVRVDMTFMREGASPVEASFEVGAKSRFTLNLKNVPGLEHASVSTEVHASGDVICERSMYYDYNGMVGGHNAVGISEAGRQWFLAEGYTAGRYDTYVLVQNPGAAPADVNVSFLRSDGHQKDVGFTLAPRSRKTVKIDDVPGFEAAEVSTEVTSDTGVIAERAMYFDSGGRDGGHDSAGVSEPSGTWYLAEGYTGGSFDTWVLMMNPGKKPVTVTTTFLRSDGHRSTRTDTLKARSRFTIHVDEQPGFEDAEVSTLVESAGGTPVIAERAMYFSYNGAWAGGHDAAGVGRAATTWYFAEGYTGL
jgi:hypothetical protein